MDHAVFPRWEAARGPRAVSRPHSSSSGGPSISLDAGAELWGSWCCSAQAEVPFIADETQAALCSPGRGGALSTEPWTDSAGSPSAGRAAVSLLRVSARQGPLPWEVCGEGGQPAPCRNVFRMTQCGDAQHPLCAHGGPVLLCIEASWGGRPARAHQGPDTRCRL